MPQHVQGCRHIEGFGAIARGTRRRFAVAVGVLLGGAIVLSGCTGQGNASSATGGDAARSGAATRTGPSTGEPSPSAPSPAAASTAAQSAGVPSASPSALQSILPGSPPALPSPSAAASFVASISTVTAAQLGASWHAGCPVAPSRLRQITLSYWGFDNAPHTGVIIVSAQVAPSVVKIFSTLYRERFPIRRMQPIADFAGSDDASMAADNTSGFNCRYAVAPGAPQWSVHAYGEAIDVNTVENPYFEGGKVLPPAGASFAQRTQYRPGMAVWGGQLVDAFAAAGWQWGGRWTASPDYQHFSSTGG